MNGSCGVRLGSARVAVWVVLCAAVYPVISFAQQAAEKAHAAMHVDDRRLILDLVVHDHAGNLVPGLQEQDFLVLDNQRPQKVLSFVARAGHDGQSSGAEPPPEIVLLVDEVNTRFDHVAYERDEIKRFAMQHGGRLTPHVYRIFY